MATCLFCTNGEQKDHPPRTCDHATHPEENGGRTVHGEVSRCHRQRSFHHGLRAGCVASSPSPNARAGKRAPVHDGGYQSIVTGSSHYGGHSSHAYHGAARPTVARSYLTVCAWRGSVDGPQTDHGAPGREKRLMDIAAALVSLPARSAIV